METQKQQLNILIISLVCGILGIVLTFPPAAIAGLILAIVGLVISIMAKKEGKEEHNVNSWVHTLHHCHCALDYRSCRCWRITWFRDWRSGYAGLTKRFIKKLPLSETLIL